MNWGAWLEFLIGAGLTLFGVAIGRRTRPRPPEPLRPICSCGHGYGMHHDGNGCGAEVKRANRWDTRTSHETPIGWTYVACACRRYDGPSPALLGLDLP